MFLTMVDDLYTITGIIVQHPKTPEFWGEIIVQQTDEHYGGLGI